MPPPDERNNGAKILNCITRHNEYGRRRLDSITAVHEGSQAHRLTRQTDGDIVINERAPLDAGVSPTMAAHELINTHHQLTHTRTYYTREYHNQPPDSAKIHCRQPTLHRLHIKASNSLPIPHLFFLTTKTVFILYLYVLMMRLYLPST